MDILSVKYSQTDAREELVTMVQMTNLEKTGSNDKDTPEDPFYSDCNMSFLREGIDALNSGKGTIHDLIEEDGF